jgi:hypothetical protein
VDLSRAGIVTMLASMDVQPETVALLHSLKPVRLAIGSRWVLGARRPDTCS